MKNWNHLSDEELLLVKVRDLDLDIERTPLVSYIEQLRSELRRRGLSFNPNIWLGDEWCNPEGSTGVVVPFTLAHPRLIRLERQYVGFAEGTTENSFMRLLRHEVGHAIESAYNIVRHPLREMVFGNTDRPYPKSYRPDKQSRDFVRHLPNYYAQAHPDEDFAETFAVWVTEKKHWRELYRNWGALDKLKVMDLLMRDACDLTPIQGSRIEKYHYKNLNMSCLNIINGGTTTIIHI
ncbi:MAG: putative zinc-binding metallopeptidase [Bdellovibrionales bacterium]